MGDCQPLRYLLHSCGTSEEEVPLGLRQLPLLAHDLHAEHEAVDELVLLEEPSGDVGVRGEEGLLQEDVQAVLQVIRLLRGFNRCVEQLQEKEDWTDSR